MKIRFSSMFYPPAAIRKAVLDYKNIAVFVYRQEAKGVSVRVKNIRNKSLEPLFKQEFCNYVLSLAGAIK